MLLSAQHCRIITGSRRSSGSNALPLAQRHRRSPLAVLPHLRTRQRQQQQWLSTQHHHNLVLVTAAASGGQEQPQQPDRDGGLGEQQQQEQQQFQRFEQQQPGQQPLSDQAAEDEAAAALLSAESAEEQIDPVLLQQQQEWQERHQRWCRTSRNVYMLLALGLTASGLLTAVAAVPLAAAGLRLGVGLGVQQAAVLVGCFGAAVLRAASLAWFLAEGAALGELGSWRYQRVNLGLAAAAGAAAAAVLTTGWAGAQPWLLLLLAAGSGVVTAACAALAVGQARHEGGGFYFASALGYGDVFEGVGATLRYVLYSVTCMSGALMTVMAVLAAVLGVGALSGSALLPALPWLPASASGVAAATLLHKLLGAGLLLLALQAWVLIEYAANGREITPELGVKLLFVKTAEEYAVGAGQLGPAPVHAPLRRFDLLHTGFIAAAVAQGLWLAQASAATGPGLGVLNLSDPLWGSLFWGVMGTVAYLVALVGRLDYMDVWLSFLRVADWAGGLVSLGAAALFVDWIWLTSSERT